MGIRKPFLIYLKKFRILTKLYRKTTILNIIFTQFLKIFDFDSEITSFIKNITISFLMYPWKGYARVREYVHIASYAKAIQSYKNNKIIFL